mmetsp:Transcript_13986/g.35218  ORF Transcript_13986/g.35218 Transcript_13986/m.35218 type:complete len:294 (-) Transcript_13986:890-1771(-)
MLRQWISPASDDSSRRSAWPDGGVSVPPSWHTHEAPVMIWQRGASSGSSERGVEARLLMRRPEEESGRGLVPKSRDPRGRPSSSGCLLAPGERQRPPSPLLSTLSMLACFPRDGRCSGSGKSSTILGAPGTEGNRLGADGALGMRPTPASAPWLAPLAQGLRCRPVMPSHCDGSLASSSSSISALLPMATMQEEFPGTGRTCVSRPNCSSWGSGTRMRQWMAAALRSHSSSCTSLYAEPARWTAAARRKCDGGASLGWPALLSRKTRLQTVLQRVGMEAPLHPACVSALSRSE